MEIDNTINTWYKQNKKLSNSKDLIFLNEYILSSKKTEQISISNDYIFEYISSQYKNIRSENIFKLNLMNLCEQINKYFSKIKVNCTFEKSSYNDKLIKKGNCRFIHDVYIVIYNPKNDKSYDCVFEFFEEKSHTKKCVDYDKELYLKIDKIRYYTKLIYV